MSEIKTTVTQTPRRTDWLGGVFAAAMAGVFLAGWIFDVQSFAFFLLTMLIDVVMTLAFLVWWFTRRSFTWGQRFLIVLCAIGFGVGVAVLSRRTIAQPMFLLLTGLPILVAVWWVAFIATRLAPRGRVATLLACFAIVWSPFLLLRMNGYLGNLRADLHWRWTPTAEQLYLAQHPPGVAITPTTQAAGKTLELQPGDWPGFRGPRRDGIVRGLKIATDWEKSPPKVLWRVGLPAALQVCLAGPNSIVLGNGAAFGTQRLELSPGDAPPTRKWVTPRVKPAFSDMVYHDGFIYGFDGTVFCCVDAGSGDRKWREGRYGAGQVLLIEDSGVMIVTTEDGQAVLLKCNPERSEELGRVQAVSGKAWNHQAIAGDRLYVRSDAEMACLQLQSIR